MWLSDLSVKRPVLATVVNLLIVIFGLVSFLKLPLREYPKIDSPIISIETSYKGASASVVESRITKIIESRIAGIEGIKTIDSKSVDGRSDITIEFDIDRDIDAAAADVRDKVSSLMAALPKGVNIPEISKADSDDDVIIWLNLVGSHMSIFDLSDYTTRYIKDRFSAIDGVARVRIGGGLYKSIRIWIDRNELAARNLTVSDIEEALVKENVELPAGTIESRNIDFTVRINRNYKTVKDFENLILSEGDNGYLIKLSDVARVEIAPSETRSTLRSNGVPMVGIGIIKQSNSNTLDVAHNVKKEMEKINQTIPANMKLQVTIDNSIFIESAIKEVYYTLFIAVVFVVMVIFAFLGDVKAMLIPALTLPVSLIGTFVTLYMAGYSINLLTLLALVLATGLVVDDAIVVVENIHKRIELGEPPLLAALRGSRQVAFAVISTTLVLITVFLPLMFLDGDTGRLMREFSVAIAAAITFSGFTALTLTPMLASKLLRHIEEKKSLINLIDIKFDKLKNIYLNKLKIALEHPFYAIGLLVTMILIGIALIKIIPSEFAPKEDRGTFIISMRGPEGASYNYMLNYVTEVEKRLLPYVENKEFEQLLLRTPSSFASSSFNTAKGTVGLADWNSGRKPIFHYINKVREITQDITGVKFSIIARQSFGRLDKKPVQFVIGGPTYQELAKWRDIIITEASTNPKLLELSSDYWQSKPHIGIAINKDSAAALGVQIIDINTALQTLLGSKRVTTFEDNGQEYDVILESDKKLKRTPDDINNIYVRSYRSGELIPLSNLIILSDFADAAVLNRYNKVRSITIEADLDDAYNLGEALNYLKNIVHDKLPDSATIDYKGDSLKYVESASSIYYIFLLAFIIVFLVLAGQFESIIHPLIIIFTVPLAITGALMALWISHQTLNIYSQIGLIILIGIATKNGILIVEFANQLRAEGVEFEEAILNASARRLRPIVMTTITTAIGAIPLIIANGAGSESRTAIGLVIFWGVIVATILTIFIIPVLYNLLAKRTNPINHAYTKLSEQEQRFIDRV